MLKLRWGLSDKIDVVVPYGGIDRKPTQHNDQPSYGKEERGWFDHGGSVSGGIVGLSVEGS